MKKTLLMLLCFLIIGIQATVADETESEVQPLTMEEALNLAYENNIDIQKAVLQQEYAQTQDSQLDKIRDLDDKLLTDLQSKRQKYVTAKQAELGVDIANLSVDYTKLNTTYQVKSAYYQVLLKQEELEKAQLLDQQVTQQVDAASKRHDLGMISKLQLDQVKNQQNKVNLQLEQSKNGLNQSKQELNLLIGQSLDYAFEIDGTLDNPAVAEELSVEDLYQQALKNRPDVLQTMIDRDIKQINYELTARIYPSNVYEHRLVKAEYEIAELDWLNKQKQTRIDLQKAVDGYQLANQSLVIAQEDLRLAEKEYNIAEAKYQQGLLSELDLLSEQVKFNGTKLNYLNSQYQAWLSLFQLERSVGLPLEEITEEQ